MTAFAVKDALIALLEQSAAGRYQVGGIPKRKLDAKNVLAMPSVTVYYNQGSFPRNRSSINGPYQHESSLRIDIVAAAVAEMDLTPIVKGGTPDQIAAALAAKVNADVIVDALVDETAGLIFDIIMRPQNRSLGLGYNPDRWITEYEKDKPQSSGAVVILAACFTMTFQVPEFTTEEQGKPGGTISHEAEITYDQEGETKEGVSVNAPL
jgi:hypothetical protein